MEMSKFGKLWALVLAVAVPMSMMAAETSGAVISATNSARLNGNEFSKTAAIFPGDKLSVPDNSTVTITMKGTSILVPNNSNLDFADNSIQLGTQTAVAVNTTAGMTARVVNVSVAPKDGSAKYEVARYNGQVFVAAKQGTVLLASAAGTKVIPAGTSASVPDPEPQNPTSKPATTGISGMPTWVAEVIGLAAVGAAAGIGIAATNKSSASPAVP